MERERERERYMEKYNIHFVFHHQQKLKTHKLGHSTILQLLSSKVSNWGRIT